MKRIICPDDTVLIKLLSPRSGCAAIRFVLSDVTTNYHAEARQKLLHVRPALRSPGPCCLAPPFFAQNKLL